MRDSPAGDVDYEAGRREYAAIRRPEPRFAQRIRSALGDSVTLVNVGAGAGSYEPDDMDVTAVEPSAAMRAERPAHRVPAIDAGAEDLPFDDGSFDAALASFTVHQWRDLERGLAELRRVTTGPVVVMTCDPGVLASFWLADYAPEMMVSECSRMPPVDRVAAGLGGDVRVEELPIPAGCTDGFAEAFFGRPESLLDDRVRRAQSAWTFVEPEVEARSVERLRLALGDGSWDDRHGELRTAAEYRGSLRLVIGVPR